MHKLITHKIPLFKFTITTTITQFNLNNTIKHIQTLQTTTPIITQIKNHTLHPKYTQQLTKLININIKKTQQTITTTNHTKKQTNQHPIPITTKQSTPKTTPKTQILIKHQQTLTTHTN